MRARITPEAIAEINDAVAHYATKGETLGERFSRAVDRAIVEVLENSERWPFIEGVYQRYRLRKFPYGIVYEVYNGEVIVVAFMHLHRKPGYWKGRI